MKTTRSRRLLCAAVAAASLVSALFWSGGPSSAQSTFVGDYDRAFAAPNGYYIDPEEVDPAISDDVTQFFTGELLADGSIIAGGRFAQNAQESPGDFYLRRFTAAGAVDTSFGTNGLVRTNFFTSTYGGANPILSIEHPQVLKVQPDGKILFAGACHRILTNSSPPNPDVRESFGNDACVVRYNANGTLDTTFGGGTLVFTGGSLPIDAGKALFVTGTRSNGQVFGSNGFFYDMAIQPDGKIVLVGETRYFYSNGDGFGAIIVRLNPTGTLDSTFGAGGFARWTAPQGPVTGCYPARAFYGVRLQADGRIIAVGYDEVTRAQDCHTGTRFAVTRWTSGGQLETVRHVTDLANIDTFYTERATSVRFTGDGSKLLVSGSARNLSGTPAGRQKPTLARFNLSELSLDTSFGSGGIAQYSVAFDSWAASTLYIKAVQPDGKTLGTDNTPTNGNVVRLNADGSPDLSFGNLGMNGSPGAGGRLRLLVTTYNGLTPLLEAGHILVRPNGRFNLLGHGAAHSGQGILRAAVSQNIAGNTQPGGDVIVQTAAGDARVTFSQVTAGGETIFTPINSASAGAPPAGYTILTDAPAYDITTTAQFTPPVTVCLTVSSVSDQTTFARVRVLHGEGGQLVDRTILAPDSPAPDFASRRVCARVQTLSPFVAALAPAAPTVQFSAAGSAVSESDPRANVTVTRTGDTSGAATVDYRTEDADTFTVGCADAAGAAGSAYARCDFATSVGTLHFAAGETTKTVTVPIIDDAHVEGPQTFQLRLSNASGATLGSFATATVTITDNDTGAAPNPAQGPPHEFFVRQQYLDFLSREPDAGGFQAWLGVLNNCPNANTGPEVQSGCDRIFVSGEGFFRSVEFSLKGAYVFRFYKVAFNRLPEYTEIVADMSFVAGATEQEVFQRRAELAARFTQRAEFQSAFSVMTNEQYVAALLGRYNLTQVTTRDPASPDTGAKQVLTAAQLAALPRDRALRAIADSDEVTAREFNNAFVAMQYYGYLRRKPEPSGYAAWLVVLQSGDVRAMVNGFLNSQEYRLRFGQP
jgi:uncharacterized delta-60 repeat protein